MLEFKLTEGHTRNALVDLKDQRIYYLAKDQSNISEVMGDYIDYFHKELAVPEYKYLNPVLVEIIEFRDDITDVDLAMTMAEFFGSGFVSMNIQDKEHLIKVVKEMSDRLIAGHTALHRIYLIITDKMYAEFGKIKLPAIFQLLTREYVEFKRIIALKNFVPTIDVVNENQVYNSFFNGRIIVDSDNFSGLKEIFDHLPSMDQDLLLEELDRKKNVCRYWNIGKNRIQVCRDCEFRDICVDANELKETANEGIWQRSVECNYNPYAGKWLGEDGYETIRDSIDQGLITMEYIERMPDENNA